MSSDTEITPEWCLNMARLEEGHEIGAGSPDHPLRRLTPTASEATAIGAGEVIGWLEAEQKRLDDEDYIMDTSDCINVIQEKIAASPKVASDTDTAIPAGEGVQYPSLELCVQFSDDGQHIRKWSRIPFDGGTDFYSHPAASPEPDTDTKRLVFDGDSLGDYYDAIAQANRQWLGTDEELTDTPVDPGVEGVTQAMIDAAYMPITGYYNGWTDERETAIAVWKAMCAAKPIAGMDAGEVDDA